MCANSCGSPSTKTNQNLVCRVERAVLPHQYLDRKARVQQQQQQQHVRQSQAPSTAVAQNLQEAALEGLTMIVRAAVQVRAPKGRPGNFGSRSCMLHALANLPPCNIHKRALCMPPQMPLAYGWAITIFKSRGMVFDRAAVGATPSCLQVCFSC